MVHNEKDTHRTNQQFALVMIHVVGIILLGVIIVYCYSKNSKSNEVRKPHSQKVTLR